MQFILGITRSVICGLVVGALSGCAWWFPPKTSTVATDPATPELPRPPVASVPSERLPVPPAPPISPPAEKKIPVAKGVPGRPGLVFSPFNNKLIDVSDCKPGALVADPHYPPSERMYFRVP